MVLSDIVAKISSQLVDVASQMSLTEISVDNIPEDELSTVRERAIQIIETIAEENTGMSLERLRAEIGAVRFAALSRDRDLAISQAKMAKLSRIGRELTEFGELAAGAYAVANPSLEVTWAIKFHLVILFLWAAFEAKRDGVANHNTLNNPEA